MQLTWRRTVHSGDWCLRSALRTLSGACQKWWWWYAVGVWQGLEVRVVSRQRQLEARLLHRQSEVWIDYIIIFQLYCVWYILINTSPCGVRSELHVVGEWRGTQAWAECRRHWLQDCFTGWQFDVWSAMHLLHPWPGLLSGAYVSTSGLPPLPRQGSAWGIELVPAWRTSDCSPASAQQ